MPRYVIQSFVYVSMYIVGGNHRSSIASRFSMYHTYIVGGNHRSNIASRFSMYHTYTVGGNHRSHIASRFSIYRSNKILQQTVLVNREKSILRDFPKIFRQWRLQCQPLLCHRMDEVQFRGMQALLTLPR